MDLVDVYIARHSIPEPEHPDHPFDDSARRLTADGRMRAGVAFRALRRMGLVPDVIWTSPYVRAKQTAEIAKESLSVAGPLEICDELAIGGSVRAIIEMLPQVDIRRLMIVGHQPNVSDLVSALISTDAVVRQAFNPGGVAHIRLHAVRNRFVGELAFYASQHVLYELGTHLNLRTMRTGADEPGAPDGQ